MEQLFTKPVLDIFHALNGNVRLVGGVVRDSLLHKPVMDIDMATPYSPDEVMNLLLSHGIRIVPTGLKHGTITALRNGTGYEITTLRKDVETDGRHATIAFTDSYEADANRRDFTMNALYMDEKGTIYDYTGGQEDLKNRYVRFIGNADERVKEDYLRILRYFRFWGKLGYNTIDETALSACTRNAVELNQISKERKRDELLKILAQDQPAKTLRLMQQADVLPYVLSNPDMDALERFMAVKPHGDVLERLSILIGLSLPPLALSNKQKDTLKRFGKDIDTADLLNKSKLVLFENGHNAFEFYIYRALSQNQIDFIQAQNLLETHMPVFPINGADLLKMGIAEGPQIKQALDKAKLLWIANEYTDNKKLVLKELMTYNKE